MKNKLFFVGGLILLMGIFFGFDLDQYLNLTLMQGKLDMFRAYYEHHPLVCILLYVVAYIFVASFSIPGATILTLLGGALFGVFLGTGLIAVGATIGATLAFLSARYVFRDSLELRYQSVLTKLNNGLLGNALHYVLFLRLVPAFPFFLINLVLGLSRVSLGTYVLATFFGMLPGIFVYANAGRQLATLNSISDILSVQMLGAFVLLGIMALMPVAIKKIKP